MHKKENRGTYKKELKCNMGHSERSKIHDAQTKRSKSERERQIPCDITCMWNLKYSTNEPIFKTETDSQT